MFIVSPTAVYFVFTCLFSILFPPSPSTYPSDFRLSQILSGKVKLLLVQAHCYLAYPCTGEVYPLGQNINRSMHSRSGKFGVSSAICVLMEGKHTQSSKIWVFSLTIFCFLHCLIFHIHDFLYFGVFWEKSALIKLLDEHFFNLLYWALFFLFS